MDTCVAGMGIRRMGVGSLRKFANRDGLQLWLIFRHEKMFNVFTRKIFLRALFLFRKCIVITLWTQTSEFYRQLSRDYLYPPHPPGFSSTSVAEGLYCTYHGTYERFPCSGGNRRYNLYFVSFYFFFITYFLVYFFLTSAELKEVTENEMMTIFKILSLCY